jgi:hypothetical protein
MDAEDVAAYRAMTPPEKLTRVWVRNGMNPAELYDWWPLE